MSEISGAVERHSSCWFVVKPEILSPRGLIGTYQHTTKLFFVGY